MPFLTLSSILSLSTATTHIRLVGIQYMQTSRYNLLFEQPETGQLVLYNTLYGSISICAPNETPLALQLLSNPKSPDPATAPLKRCLSQQNHLVPETRDELRLLYERRRQGFYDANRLDLIILPTLDCNFACTYCFEQRKSATMSEATRQALERWLTKRIPMHKVTVLHWFGGEPLIAKTTLISLTAHALKTARDAAVTCIPHITTNGYLLTDSTASKLLKLGIRNFQITVDGPQPQHDSLRKLRSGRGTFSRIFRNIIGLARLDHEVKISLRVNFNHTNLDSIPTLLQLFPTDVRAQLRVVFEPIFGSCSLSALDNLTHYEISHKLHKHYLTAADLGYDVVLSGANLAPGKLVYCYAERQNQLLVSYDGSVFKCSVGTFDHTERVGYIGTDGTLYEDQARWGAWVNAEPFSAECENCVYLPLCMGGCRKTRAEMRSNGSQCALVPSNTSYALKQVSLGFTEQLVLRSLSGSQTP